MDEDLSFTISIPPDDDGFVLLKCPVCGEFFKLTPGDIEDEGIMEIHCPCCCFSSYNVGDFVTDDVIELAERIAKNMIEEQLQKAFDKTAFKVSRQDSLDSTQPIVSGIEALSIVHYQCCHRNAKIKPLLKLSSSCCPFCGVKNFGI